MTEKQHTGTNTICPSYRGVRITEESIKRELTVTQVEAQRIFMSNEG